MFKKQENKQSAYKHKQKAFFAMNLVSALLMAVCNKKGAHKRRPEPQMYTSLVEVESDGCFYNSHTTPQPYCQHRKSPVSQDDHWILPSFQHESVLQVHL